MWTCLTLLSRALTNGKGGKVYATCVFTTIESKKKKEGEIIKLLYSHILSENLKVFF